MNPELVSFGTSQERMKIQKKALVRWTREKHVFSIVAHAPMSKGYCWSSIGTCTIVRVVISRKPDQYFTVSSVTGILATVDEIGGNPATASKHVISTPKVGI